MNEITREYFLEMKEGEIVNVNGIDYMKVGSTLMGVKEDAILMLGFDF